MEDRQDTTQERMKAEIYRFLSACFCLPQKEPILQEGVLKQLSRALAHTCPEAVPICSEMEKAFLESDEEELKVEYARLFVGPYELKAPPYGSVYLDGEKRVMGDSTIEVIRLYQEAGVRIDDNLKDLPDHIAVELEFIYYLIRMEAKAFERSEREKALAFQEMRNRFENQFLKPWVFRFCQKIEESSTHPFYTNLANCLSTFIAYQGRSSS